MTKHDPEFCARVAEAVGLKAEVWLPGKVDDAGWGGFDEPVCVIWPSTIEHRAFRPDVDWNDGIWALDQWCLKKNIPAYEFIYKASAGWSKRGPRGLLEDVLKLKENQ